MLRRLLWNPASRFVCRSYATQASPWSNVSPLSLTQIRQLVAEDLGRLHHDIRQLLNTSLPELRDISHFYFSATTGKSLRPMLTLLMSRAINWHASNGQQTGISQSQRTIALISELMHTASLVHDDVIDGSPLRRGTVTVCRQWGARKAVLAGDYMLGVCSWALASIGDASVVKCMAQVLEDLVTGELMQLGSQEHPQRRFDHYMAKTYRKTGSLMANSCRAVAMLANSDPNTVESAFQYGRHVGLAFQLVDDALDFVGDEAQLGKPASADIRSGLATAPVLFACERYSQLDAMIMRRFSSEGDSEEALELVQRSDGIAQTRQLAEEHAASAATSLGTLKESMERRALQCLAHELLLRDR